MKCVGTPMSLRFWNRNSLMRLLRTPLPSITSNVLGVEGSGVVLEMLDQSALGSNLSKRNFRLSFVKCGGGGSSGHTVV